MRISLAKGDPSIEELFHNLFKLFASNLVESPSLLTLILCVAGFVPCVTYGNVLTERSLLQRARGLRNSLCVIFLDIGSSRILCFAIFQPFINNCLFFRFRLLLLNYSY